MNNKQNIIAKIYNNLYWYAKVKKYRSYGSGYVFDINVDDFHYKLSFLSHPIGPAIVQRIEGRREPETMAIYRTLIRPGHKVLELGACYGEFTILIDHLVGSEGKLVSVEGTPNTYSILENNLRINNLKNTEIYNMFVTNSSKDIVYNAEDTHPYNAIERLKSNKTDKVDDQIVQKSMRVTSFLDKIKFNPDVIVMDIEGFEIDVLEDLFDSDRGAKYRPTILFEIHEHMYDKGLDYVYSLLDNEGYMYINIAGNLLCYK